MQRKSHIWQILYLLAVKASHREAISLLGLPGPSDRPLIEISGLSQRPSLLQKDWASYREGRPLTERMGLYQRGRVHHREDRHPSGKEGPLTGCHAFSQRGPAYHFGVASPSGRVPHREAGPVTMRQGRVSLKERSC